MSKQGKKYTFLRSRTQRLVLESKNISYFQFSQALALTSLSAVFNLSREYKYKYIFLIFTWLKTGRQANTQRRLRNKAETELPLHVYCWQPDYITAIPSDFPIFHYEFPPPPVNLRAKREIMSSSEKGAANLWKNGGGGGSGEGFSLTPRREQTEEPERVRKRSEWGKAAVGETPLIVQFFSRSTGMPPKRPL